MTSSSLGAKPKIPSRSVVKVGLVLKSGGFKGGAATYENAVLRAMNQLSDESLIELVVFTPGLARSFRGVVRGRLVSYRFGKIFKFASLFRTTLFGALIGRLFGPSSLEKQFFRNHIDLAYFASPNLLAAGVRQTPIVSTVWDLGHRDLSYMEEFSSPMEFIARETFLNDVVVRSFKVVTDSQQTGKRIQEITGILRTKWTSFGMAFAAAVSSPDLAQAKNQTLVYPAQGWKHKNHEVLIEAFSKISQSWPNSRLVFTGNLFGRAEELAAKAEAIGIADQVDFLGVLADESLQSLISSSSALLMPSLLGPTNIPPLEAAVLGTRLVISDVHSFDEDLPSDTIVVEPFSATGWASAMEVCLKEPTAVPHQFPLEGVKGKLMEIVREWKV